MADQKLVTLYSKAGAKVQVTDKQAESLKKRGFAAQAPKS